VITNFSSEEQPVRVRIRFQVGYDADLGLTRKVAYVAQLICPTVAQLNCPTTWKEEMGGTF